MDGDRFDHLTKAVVHHASRRGVLRLLAGGLLGGTLGFRGLTAAAQDVIADRIGCRGRCTPGQECRHGACLDPCPTPGTCTPGSNGPPPCGPTGANCGCVALRSGDGFCLTASRSTPGGNGCRSKACHKNRDCAVGQVCAVVPGCCQGKNRICAVPCPA